ncbi:MAG: alpha/beta fold hydrolase [Gammaproteobacteria bacterium]
MRKSASARDIYTGSLLFLFTSIAVVLPAASAHATPAPGLMVLVGGHRLHLYCSGVGEPVVIMDSGLGGTSLDWSRVQPRVSEFTRVCVYDRAGYGWSETGPLPRTSRRIAGELHALLQTAGVQGPYVLVGHSFGGYNMQLFASRYPQDTAGVVLVDSSHADQYRRFRRAGLRHMRLPGRNFFMRVNLHIPENMPVPLQPLLRALASKEAFQSTVYYELRSMGDSARQVGFAEFPPDVPLIVLTRGRRVWPDDSNGNRSEALWLELQDDLLARSTVASQLVAGNSGHYIHLDEPVLVVRAIRRLVEARRGVTAMRASW